MTYGYGQRSGFGGMRFLIAGALALFAIVGYFMKTSVNPVTGEKQRVGMDQNQEMALGLQAVPEMESQMGGSLDAKSSPEAARVDKVGRRLAYDTPESSKDPYAQAQNYHFHLLADEKTINAFALPGGQVFITKALYDKLQNEAQLAGVLGHEVGHVINRHSAQQMAKGQLGGMLATAVGVGASDGSGKGQMAQVAAQMANQVIQLRYSRTDELEADAYGLRLMMELGYDPREMLGVMEILKSVGGGGGTPDILKTHPDPDARIEQINQMLEKDKEKIAKLTLTKGPPLR